jgi:CheY-like chemotaxis protein
MDLLRARFTGATPTSWGKLISGFFDKHLSYNAELSPALRGGGAWRHSELPLEADPGFLQTIKSQTAPAPDGRLDMTARAGLIGQQILVAEDDYCIALDAAGAARSAGAEVMGPYSTDEEVLAALRRARPIGALLDINLGNGPSFEVARELRARGIPFVFITGYDQTAIPPEFADTPRLEKPVELDRAVDLLAAIIAAAH